jgi:hypothetical protein
VPFQNVAPFSFSLASVENNAPGASGLYGLSNAREWIFVGETDNIKGSLLAHLRETGRLEDKQPTGFTFELCMASNRVSRQDVLIRELEPVCNRRDLRFRGH